MKGSVFSRLADLFWPRKCVICRRILDREPGILCPACRARMPQPQKGPKRGESYERCVSVCSYEGAWRSAILRFKFEGRFFYADLFGSLLAERIREELDGTFDLVTYVPLSRSRRRHRGYDQAELLARSTAQALGFPVCTLLKRTVHRAPQSGIRNAASRRANILNVYKAADPSLLIGKRVLLIDDILTTGATLSEASRILLQAGAESVVCATLALTPNK